MNDFKSTLPQKFLDRVDKIVPSNKLAEVLSAFNQKRPTTIRANTLKISAKELLIEMQKLGVKLQPVPWWENAFIVENQSLRYLTETAFYKNGYFYVQSLSSMLPVLILKPQKGEKVLDICAAPGSKTTQMASVMENMGEIVANDTSWVRLERLKANIRIQSAEIVTTEKMPGQIVWQKYREYFDKTLVDVPCSMEGRFYGSDPKTYQDWSTNKIKQLVQTQKFILRSAISATRPGGVIVYSTCTLSPEENEGIIDWILKKEGDNIMLEKVELTGLKFDPALSSWNNRDYDQHIKLCARILPSSEMEGFFIAKIRKISSNLIIKG